MHGIKILPHKYIITSKTKSTYIRDKVRVSFSLQFLFEVIFRCDKFWRVTHGTCRVVVIARF